MGFRVDFKGFGNNQGSGVGSHHLLLLLRYILNGIRVREFCRTPDMLDKNLFGPLKIKRIAII